MEIINIFQKKAFQDIKKRALGLETKSLNMFLEQMNKWSIYLETCLTVLNVNSQK